MMYLRTYKKHCALVGLVYSILELFMTETDVFLTSHQDVSVIFDRSLSSSAPAVFKIRLVISVLKWKTVPRVSLLYEMVFTTKSCLSLLVLFTCQCFVVVIV